MPLTKSLTLNQNFKVAVIIKRNYLYSKISYKFAKGYEFDFWWRLNLNNIMKYMCEFDEGGWGGGGGGGG